MDFVRHDGDMTATAVLARMARRGRSAARAPHVPGAAAISIRVADSGDAAAIARLAQLAESDVPTGPALVAEVDGEVWAALPLGSERALVDPFRPSCEIRQLLRLRAAQLERDAA